MELVEGETLETRLRKSGPLPPSLALEVITQAARALVALETHGLVHRDLKPANLMLVERPELTVKMIDFGLAKAAATAKGESDITHGGFVGTPSFASPEQFTNTRACRRPPLPLREPNWEAAADNPGTGQDFISQTTRYRKRCFWSGGELRQKNPVFAWEICYLCYVDRRTRNGKEGNDANHEECWQRQQEEFWPWVDVPALATARSCPDVTLASFSGLQGRRESVPGLKSSLQSPRGWCHAGKKERAATSCWRPRFH